MLRRHLGECGGRQPGWESLKGWDKCGLVKMTDQVRWLTPINRGQRAEQEHCHEPTARQDCRMILLLKNQKQRVIAPF